MSIKILPGVIPDFISYIASLIFSNLYLFEISFSKYASEDYVQHKLPHKLDQNNDPNAWVYDLDFLNK